MENEVKEEVKVETKKKNNGLFTAFACVMTGAIVFMATNLGQKASKVVDPDTNGGSTTTSNVESNVTSNIESNITSQITSNTTSNTTTLSDAVKNEILSKLKVLFPDTNGTNLAARYRDSVINIFKSKLTEADKTNLVLASVDSKSYITYTATDAKNGKFASTTAATEVKEDAINSTKAIPASVMAAQYKSVFGTEPKYVDGPNDCPIYYFDSVKKAYIPVSRCGGASYTDTILYIDKYEMTDENTVTVWTYVGAVYGSASNDTVIYDRPDFHDSKVKVATVPEGTVYEINASNKLKFANYAFTFKKASDGHFYLDKVTYSQA